MVWRYFKFRAVGDDFDKSFVHCKLCLDAGNKKKGQVKYCGGTTNLVQHLKSWHNEDHKAVKEEEEKAKGKMESILHHFAARKSVEKWPKSTLERPDHGSREVVLQEHQVDLTLLLKYL